MIQYDKPIIRDNKIESVLSQYSSKQIDLPIFKLRTLTCNLDHHQLDAQIKQIISHTKWIRET